MPQEWKCFCMYIIKRTITSVFKLIHQVAKEYTVGNGKEGIGDQKS